MDKKFKTYNQQMKYLRDSKNIICNGSSNKTILIRTGYFNLINGYKTPFVQSIDSQGKHIYYGGTTIEHFYAVKNFDDEIRHILLKYLTKVEEEMRTVIGYEFDKFNNNAKINWYEVQAYSPDSQATDIIKSISNCYSDISINRSDYVRHYLDNHHIIPTWVLMKVISFSHFINFISICKQPVVETICEIYGILDEKGAPSKDLLISMLHLFRKIRNSCAHNERIYEMQRKNGRVNVPFKTFLLNPKPYTNIRSQTIVDCFVCLRYFLDDCDYFSMINLLKNEYFKLQEKINSNVFSKVRASTGVKQVGLFDELLTVKKSIDYNRL